MRSLRHHGFSGATMADIISESGLSAGAIYGNFENKAELVRYVASQVIEGRTESVEQLVATSDPYPSPGQIIEFVLTELVRQDAPFDVIVQFWGEAAVDPEMGVTVRSLMADLETMFAGAVEPWLTERLPGDQTARAADLARVMLTACQGFIVYTSVTGDLEPASYVAGLRTLLPD